MAVDRQLEARMRRLRRRQHAAASWEQLLDAGWTRAQIRTRVDRREWQRPFRSVYILGDPAVIPLAVESAVLLSLGPDAALSCRTSAYLWGQIDHRPQIVEVMVARAAARPRPGVRIHLVGSLDAKDVRARHGLWVTSPARTVIDLAIDASSSELEHAASESVAKRLMNEHDLLQALNRAPQNHPGAARLRARMAEDSDLLLHTRSVAERIAYPLILEAGLARPHLNEIVEGHRVDLHWPQHRLIVEIDGFQYHHSRHAFETDRRRDQILTAAGYTVIRITRQQLTTEPYRVIATIAQALTRAERAAA